MEKEAPEEENVLLDLLRTKPRSKTELLKTGETRRRARETALKRLIAHGKVLRIHNRYFLDEPPGSVERLIQAETARLEEHLQSLPELVSRSGMKIRRGVQNAALVAPALERLLNEGRVVQLRYNKAKLCVHTAHLPRVPLVAGRETASGQNESLPHPAVHQAYERVRARQLGSAVFISDLAAELKVAVPVLHDWIRREVIDAGDGSLDEGHWPTATNAQRKAAVDYLGSKRLLIRF